MCQLNLFLVSKSLDKDLLDKIIKDSEIPYIEVLNDYLIKGNYHLLSFNAKDSGCTCDSIISKLINTPYSSFEEYKVLSIKEQAKKLEKIADYMLETDYQERLAVFNEEMEEKIKAMDILSNWISEKERELTEEIMLRTDISDTKKSNLMFETVYPQINELIEANEKKPEVIEARKSYAKFIADNQMMWDSAGYTLEEVEDQVFETEPLTLSKAIELSGYQPSDNHENELYQDSPTITIPSNNIFKAIKANQEVDFSEYNLEFARIKAFLTTFLDYLDEIKIISFYWDGDTEIKDEKMISLKELSIDDLLFLPSATKLTIRKK
ncbi:MAG: hypothetical protein FWE36_01390 [Erysipelotrichales bacterium]|nr:hypothetical protein [Erysipelotrichales bacterium]